MGTPSYQGKLRNEAFIPGNLCQLNLGSVTEEGEGIDVGEKVAAIVIATECENGLDHSPRDFFAREQRVVAVGNGVFTRGGVGRG